MDYVRTLQFLITFVYTDGYNPGVRPSIFDKELTVSERLSALANETENCLLASPEESILGLAGVRMELEGFIAIKLQDKMRQNIRIKDGSNRLDVKYISELSREDIFEMIKKITPHGRGYAALNRI